VVDGFANLDKDDMALNWDKLDLEIIGVLFGVKE
jgi:hypothetical protein